MEARTRKVFMVGAFLCAAWLPLFTGCAGQQDAISQAANAEKRPPGVAETKAIAEEGFIYRLHLAAAGDREGGLISLFQCVRSFRGSPPSF